MKYLLLFLLPALVCSQGTIDQYYLLKDKSGVSGNCRGNGGTSDKVNARSKRGFADSLACSLECDKLSECVGFAFNTAVSECVLYGPGMSGTCSLGPGYTEQTCGSCTGAGAPLGYVAEFTCGSCSVQTPSNYEASENVCIAAGGTWTANTWTSATWELPGDGWTGDSHASVNIHSLYQGVIDWYCYDKNRYDAQAHCNGTATTPVNGNADCGQLWSQNKTCAPGCTFTAFNSSVAGDLPWCDGTATDVTVDCRVSYETSGSEDACTAIPGCTYIPATVNKPLKIGHTPPIEKPGWSLQTAFGDLVTPGSNTNNSIGACRVEGTQVAKPNAKNCKNENCYATNETQVGLQLGCAQACLDSPTVCTAYAQADNSWCVLYGPKTQATVQVGRPPNGTLQNYTWGDDPWPLLPCVSEGVPEGCMFINSAKPNPGYVCFALNTDLTRWDAVNSLYEDNPVEEKVVVTFSTTGAPASGYTSTFQTSSRQRIANLAFKPLSSVAIAVGSGDTPQIEYHIMSNVHEAPQIVKTLAFTFSNSPDNNPSTYDEVMGNSIPSAAEITAVEITTTTGAAAMARMAGSVMALTAAVAAALIFA